MNSRLPNYKVRALDKQTDEKATVGAAWNNKDGTISIILDPFTVLIGRRSLLITLFLRDREEVK